MERVLALALHKVFRKSHYELLLRVLSGRKALEGKRKLFVSVLCWIVCELKYSRNFHRGDLAGCDTLWELWWFSLAQSLSLSFGTCCHWCAHCSWRNGFPAHRKQGVLWTTCTVPVSLDMEQRAKGDWAHKHKDENSEFICDNRSLVPQCSSDVTSTGTIHCTLR